MVNTVMVRVKLFPKIRIEIKRVKAVEDSEMDGEEIGQKRRKNGGKKSGVH